MNKKIILTDCDGVLLNWEYAFECWMEEQGYQVVPGTECEYDQKNKFGITKEECRKAIRMFNQSAAIAYLPPLRDAMYYVDLLHRKHGYRFHMITSLSKNKAAQKLRTKNIKKLFGKTAFEEYIYLDTGADKTEVLEQYKDSGLLWIEDKIENAEVGRQLGLDSILMEHGHNMHEERFPLTKNWKSVYNYIIDNRGE